MTKLLILKPRLSEKAYAMSERGNTYVFDVPPSANRHMVADAVTDQYSVEVASVKMAATAPKPLNSYKKRSRNTTAHRAGVRKAYVTLKEGHKLPIFATADEKPAKESK